MSMELVIPDDKGDSYLSQHEQSYSTSHISKDLIMLLHGLYLPLTIILNGVVIIAGVLNPMLCSSATDVAILALSVADFLVGCWCIPVYILHDSQGTTALVKQDKTLCIMKWFAPIFTQNVSLAMLFVLALDRCLAVNWPMFYTAYVTRFKMLVLIFTLYIYEWVEGYVVLTFFKTSNSTEPNIDDICSLHNTPEWYHKIELNVRHAVYALPTFFMTLQVIIIAKIQNYRINRQTTSAGIMLTNNTPDVKLIFMFFTLLLPLAIPSVMLVWNLRSSNLQTVQLYELWARPLRLTNSAFDSLVFAYSRKLHRMHYVHIMTNSPTRWCKTDQVRRLYFISVDGRTRPVGRRTEIRNASMITHRCSVHYTPEAGNSPEAPTPVSGGSTTQGIKTPTRNMSTARASAVNPKTLQNVSI